MSIPHWLMQAMQAQQNPQTDPWQELNIWLWRRHVIARGVPRKIFDKDDETVRNTVKLIDVAIRDNVRKINRMLLEQGTPYISPTPSSRPRCEKCGHKNYTARCLCCVRNHVAVEPC